MLRADRRQRRLALAWEVQRCFALEDGEPIAPENFVRNKVFNDFMHEFIARQGPKLKGLQAEARRQVEGWVYIIDARTATPQGKVPPHDIIGAFEVKAGQVVADSYRRNDNHVLLSKEGFFRFPPQLQKELSAELVERNSPLRNQDVGVQGNKA
jgi:hypothetical protein